MKKVNIAERDDKDVYSNSGKFKSDLYIFLAISFLIYPLFLLIGNYVLINQSTGIFLLVGIIFIIFDLFMVFIKKETTFLTLLSKSFFSKFTIFFIIGREDYGIHR